jgi:hypothetical protein
MRFWGAIRDVLGYVGVIFGEKWEKLCVFYEKIGK